jgi:hypothetical protein
LALCRLATILPLEMLIGSSADSTNLTGENVALCYRNHRKDKAPCTCSN